MKLLEKGDKIAFIAPSSAVDEKEILPALKWFENKGYAVEIMPHVFSTYRYMAGTNAQRAADVNECFLRPDIKALFCVRGGAGGLNMLDGVDYSLVQKMPKPVFGLSDSTALQNALYTKSGNVSYTGFLPVYDFKSGRLDEQVEKSLLAVFTGNKQKITGGMCLQAGKATGVMIGGCLSVFCSLCGTSYFPDLSDKILLLEDVGEKTYRVERMLKQLSMQPGFARIKGIVLGQFVNCMEADAGDGTMEEIVQDFVSGLKVPVVYGFSYGHQQSRYILPVGKEVFFDAGKCLLEY